MGEEGRAPAKMNESVAGEVEMNRRDRTADVLKRYLKVPLVGDHGRQQAQWRLAEIQKKS